MKKDCETCINIDEKCGCLSADDCNDFDQWYLDEGIAEDRIKKLEDTNAKLEKDHDKITELVVKAISILLQWEEIK